MMGISSKSKYLELARKELKASMERGLWFNQDNKPIQICIIGKEDGMLLVCKETADNPAMGMFSVNADRVIFLSKS